MSRETEPNADQFSRDFTGTSAKARAWRAFFETSAKITADMENRLYESAELRLADYNVLLLLREAPGEQLRMGELAEKMVFSPSRLSYRAKVLEQRGLIQRFSDDLDRRGTTAMITDAGRELFAEASRDHSQHVKSLFHSTISSEQAEELESICTALLGRLDHHQHRGSQDSA